MNVLIVSEDHRMDQFALLPIVGALLGAVGKPRARIAIHQSAGTHGVRHVLQWSNLENVLRMYPLVHLFLLIVDRDCDLQRRNQLDALERAAEGVLRRDQRLLAAEAWEEVETWILAGLPLGRRLKFADIRKNCHPKERYFDPYVRSRGLEDSPGRGRRVLAYEAVARYRQVRSRCRDDLGALENRIRSKLMAA